jgi:hypothetical protein
MILTVKIETDGLTDEEYKKVMAAGEVMELALNSNDFSEWCAGFHWSMKVCTGFLFNRKCKTSTYYYFDHNDGLNNHEVLNKILSGKEDLNHVEDHIANISVKVDRRNKTSVIGYTYPNTLWQYIYAWFLDSSNVSINDVAGNLAHEYCHKIGFDHDFHNTPQRPYSVPYAVGRFVANFKK